MMSIRACATSTPLNNPRRFFMAMNVHQENVLIAMRLWSLNVSELAVELARQANEEATRPLSEAQIHRALEAHRKEHSVCMTWLLDVWDQIEQENQAMPEVPSSGSSS
jgi:hypothetical protein